MNTVNFTGFDICMHDTECYMGVTRRFGGHERQKGSRMFLFRQARSSGLDPQAAVTGAQEGRVIVIDVRDHGELAMSGKASGALHIPMTRLRDMADPTHPEFCKELSPEATIAIYCASGARSQAAAMMLRQLGYTDVHNIGGLGHWVQAGGAVETV